MGTICAAREGNSTYYVYRETYRVKVNPEDQGKKRGSGKSTVRTRAVYLGTAEKILNLVQEKRGSSRQSVPGLKRKGGHDFLHLLF